jgi:Transposase DDE domain group 1
VIFGVLVFVRNEHAEAHGGFRVNASIRKSLARSKRRIQRRLRLKQWPDQRQPMFRASKIQYERAERTRALAAGGIGVIHLLARRVDLIKEIDQRLHLLKYHRPYHESDHVLNIAYNLLAGGSRLEHLELRRNDEVYLDALDAQRIPDPTTAGDFCRRFTPADLEDLTTAINQTRLKVWRQQPESFFEEATLDADGTIAATTGQCKDDMDISYDGQWGYHPLVVSLAQTSEPLFLINRPGSRPSHEGAADCLDRSIALCRQAGFRKITLRGDTDFTQTTHLDRWDAAGVKFIFGIDAMPNLVEMAEQLPTTAWRPLVRRPKYQARTKPRRKRENYKEEIVVAREFENTRLLREEVAEFDYRPGACGKTYRLVVVRKHLSHTKGQQWLFDSTQPLFYLTNERDGLPAAVVPEANRRCNQENLIAQLKGGVRALDMPVDNLVSNWAFMVMAALAWTLKAWSALLLPETGRWSQKLQSQKLALLRMEFKTYVNAWMQMPCQIIRGGRRIVYRLLSWNPWQEAFLRLVDCLQRPLRC